MGDGMTETEENLRDYIQSLHMIIEYYKLNLPDSDEFAPALAVVISHLRELNGKPSAKTVNAGIQALMDHCKVEH